MIKYNNIITVLVTVSVNQKNLSGGKELCMAMTVISQYVCLYFSVFIALCIVFLTAGVPFNPKVISLCSLGF